MQGLARYRTVIGISNLQVSILCTYTNWASDREKKVCRVFARPKNFHASILKIFGFVPPGSRPHHLSERTIGSPSIDPQHII